MTEQTRMRPLEKPTPSEYGGASYLESNNHHSIQDQFSVNRALEQRRVEERTVLRRVPPKIGGQT